MLDLVGAALDELLRSHEGRYVAADAQAFLVRELRNHREQFRLDRAVDLDTVIAVLRVVVDRRAGFRFGVDEHLGRTGVRTAAVHEAPHGNARADLGAAVEIALHLLQRVVVVGEIAHGGDAGGQVQQAVIRRDVHVHVPQARQQ